METGHNFKIATLPSIVLLTLISYDDRLEQRTKDPRGEIKTICAANESLLGRLTQILRSHIGQKDESLFISNMVAETGSTVEKSVQLLQNILLALD